ncbi:hypothetical protein RF679_01080 [Undibacterium cyanobacteriorum]|uniref:EH domain-containing protein n=1 Tax=Undibacterium cyanobacteriorum TaxID=3073561 RepID=A0ABY9RJP2_9BURK|nr:hypothetical protein [Undibacterium sp. 20NA77.5]WMW80889.1 hypothetical protein RF679_01080 [Undibacterium sp. 20NA77.5]
MSANRMDTTLSVIPNDMYFTPTPEAANEALACLSQLFPYADNYKVEIFSEPRFICPELLAESVTCPVCHTNSIRIGPIGSAERKWFAQIDEEMNDQPIEGVTAVLPACGHSVPFAQLNFNYPAGFARFVLRANHSLWNDEYLSPGAPLTEQKAALEAILGVPVDVVQTVYALLRSDRKIIEQLVGSSDDSRLTAAFELDAYPKGHFEDHSIADFYIEDMAERLLTAFRTTKHIKVKEWILRLISWANFVNEEVLAIAATELKRPTEKTLMSPILNLIQQRPQHFQHLKTEIKWLAGHTDQDIRWLCAMTLNRLLLDDGDFEVIRSLLFQADSNTRIYARLAFQKMIGSRALSDEEQSIMLLSLADPPAAFWKDQALVQAGARRVAVRYGENCFTSARKYYLTELTNISDRPIRVLKFASYVKDDESFRLGNFTGAWFTEKDFVSWYATPDTGWIQPGDSVCDDSNYGGDNDGFWAYWCCNDRDERFLAMSHQLSSATGGQVFSLSERPSGLPADPFSPCPKGMLNRLKDFTTQCLTLARNHAAREISYDEEGVRWLDDIIEQQRNSIKPANKIELVEIFGAFLGECIIRNYGGTWARYDEAICVQQSGKDAIFPFNSVFKQFENGRSGGDSVLGMYRSIAAQMRRKLKE